MPLELRKALSASRSRPARGPAGCLRSSRGSERNCLVGVFRGDERFEIAELLVALDERVADQGRTRSPSIHANGGGSAHSI